MKTFLLTLLALALLDASANAQEVELPRADSTVAADSSGIGDFEGLEDELASALEGLSETLAVIADRLANDPQLRVSALRAASTLVEVANVVVEQQSEVVEEALRRAADAVEELTADAAAESLD